MMSHRRDARRVAAAAIALSSLSLWLAGCGENLPPPRLYVLSADAAPASSGNPSPRPASTSARPISISVGPANLPEYLDRPEIVVRSGPNQLHLVDSDRWAERLSVNVSRVVAGNLALLLPEATVVVMPTRTDRGTDLDVALDLIAFEPDPAGNCTISGRWVVTGAEGRTEITSGRIAVNEHAEGDGYAAVAAAFSRGLASVSTDIANGIKARPRPRRSY
jgi:uncharacterized lipoprotein YmbA